MDVPEIVLRPSEIVMVAHVERDLRPMSDLLRLFSRDHVGVGLQTILENSPMCRWVDTDGPNVGERGSIPRMGTR